MTRSTDVDLFLLVFGLVVRVFVFDRREIILRQGGARMGTTYATGFEVYSLVWGGTDED